MKLVVFKETATRIPRKRIRRLFGLVTDEEADPDWRSCVNLVFITDEKIRKLNHQYRKLNRATDVLSFNLDLPQSKDDTFGEIYISTPTAIKQALAYKATLAEEYLRLVCHGLLHLFGYNHKRADEAVLMQERERYFLSRINGACR